MTDGTGPVAVYVHIPFCPTKCGYCDFNSYAMDGAIVGRTARAIRDEILRSSHVGRPAKTIFFGGGTPTFLPADELTSILDAVREVHPPIGDIEITSEANPGTVDAEKFSAMRAAGFNRISLGAQSFLDQDLVRLGRVHRSGEIERAVQAARDAGFRNLNLDLMFALPHQSRAAWRANLDRALDLAPDHLSLYCLTIEPNTAFYKEHLKGLLHQPEEEDQVAMYEECVARTADAGFSLYEISNFALPGRECQHNLAYWRNEEYAGYGPGAVGRVGLTRTTNLKHPERYCDAVEQGTPIAFDRDELGTAELTLERIMLGLRLTEGLPVSAIPDLDKLALMEQRDWILVDGDRVRLTPEGRHFCSEVALALA